MKSQKLKHKGNKKLNYTLLRSKSQEKYLDLRKKNLSALDTKINASLSNLNNLLNKLDRTKELVLYNNFDKKDIKALKNLDNNALILTKNLRKEANKATQLSYGYNLGSYDLETFLEYLRKKKEKIIKIKKGNKNRSIEIEEINKDKLDNYKKEFDLAYAGINRDEKIKNNTFLKNQKRMRDLYNLKLELNLIEQKKKIGEKRSFDDIKRIPSSLKDRDYKKDYKYQRIKSKYFQMYELSNSFKIENELMEKNILNEDYQTDEDIFITDNKNILPIKKKSLLKDGDNIKDNNIKNNNDNNKLLNKKKKPFSAKIIKDSKQIKNFNNSAIINSEINKTNNSKQAIRLRLNSGTNSNNNLININNKFKNMGLYKKIYENNFRNRTNQLISQINSKYSTKSSSRPLSSLSNFNSTSLHFINNNNKKKNMNRSMTNIYTSNTLKSSKSFKKYISQINKILRFSDYTTENFRKNFKELNKQKLFVKSTKKIFERKKIVNIDKIIKNLNLDKNPHSLINDKKLIYNNSLKVKLMLNLKNREILNTIILTLFDEQRRANNFFVDTSLYEKNIKKYERNKIYNRMSNKIINFEKKHDKEQIFDELDKMDENVEEFIKKIEKKDIFDEKEYKFIMVKNKNMKMMDREKRGKINFNGNLHKKHLFNKYKTIV